jgi:hypothetical protein
VVRTRTVGKEGKHARFIFRTPNNFVYDAIGFGLGQQRVEEGQMLDAVYNLKEDTWHGNGRVELKIKDFRPVKN